MAAPNITNITDLKGFTAFVTLDTATAENILGNGSSTNKVIRVNWILIANIDGTNNADITLAIHPAAGTPIFNDTGATATTTGTDVVSGTGVRLGSTITVPADSSFVFPVSPLYLYENTSLVATASVANDLSVVIGYEVIA